MWRGGLAQLDLLALSILIEVIWLRKSFEILLFGINVNGDCRF